MSLAPTYRRLYSLTSLVRCQCVLRQNLRNFSHKQTKNEESLLDKEDKDLSKVKVFLKDEKDNILGIKSLGESKLLALKHRLTLIEDKIDSQKHKYKVFKMVSNQFLSKMDTERETETETETRSDHDNKGVTKEPKHLVFSTKLNENDLMTKIKHTKRWLSRGHHITIQVLNPKNDIKAVESVFSHFETELKRFAKFNQKKIKSNKSLKFVVVPNPDIKEQLKAAGFEDQNDDELDVHSLDPNEVLSDEFEKKIEEELETKRRE